VEAVSRELDMAIISKLTYINETSGDFTQGILYNDLTRHDQVRYALHLVKTAELIKERSELLTIDGHAVDAAQPSSEPKG
jgi:hypothetical protein